MDYKRAGVYFTLLFAGFLLWTAWEQDNPTKPPIIATPNKTTTAATTSAGSKELSTVPIVAEVQSETVAPSIASVEVPSERKLEVETDLLKTTIDSLGGNIIKATLLKFPVELNQ